jgi:hypothetical protein
MDPALTSSPPYRFTPRRWLALSRPFRELPCPFMARRLLSFDVFVKVVTPVKTGVQEIYNYSKILDSGFHRNDGKPNLETCYEIINFQGSKLPIPGSRSHTRIRESVSGNLTCH